jgi:hypothetical protein
LKVEEGKRRMYRRAMDIDKMKRGGWRYMKLGEGHSDEMNEEKMSWTTMKHMDQSPTWGRNLNKDWCFTWWVPRWRKGAQVQTIFNTSQEPNDPTSFHFWNSNSLLKGNEIIACSECKQMRTGHLGSSCTLQRKEIRKD